MRFPDFATASQIDLFDEVIDVRSPAEYAEDHVPGAANCPVLDDAERAEIGTLYKQVSPFEARRRGAALVARNIARHLETAFAGRARDWRPLVYCWRGGKRSGAMTHVLREVGWQAAQLEGGYKAFRREVVAQLERLARGHRYLVLCGETGSAKSRVLETLAAAGAQVLDLERIARHRGSVLGGLPETPQPTQKRFETLVWEALRRLDPAAPVFVEAESKKVGRIQVPDALLDAMRGSECIRIAAPVPARVAFLIEEYRHFLADPAVLKTQLDCLTGLYGKATIAAWHALAERGEWEALVAELLASHYDPAYRRSTERNYPGLATARVIAPRDLSAASIAGLATALHDLARLEPAFA
jgi:tRNA 2-selenouridine synthase